MNPKLRDLQIQAFAECKTFEDSQFKTDEVFERFAELIVRECLDCIAKVHKTEYTKEFNEGYTLGVERCFYKIEDHFFGVEE